jgi:protein phosphatase
MGTTVVAALVAGTRLVVGNVGDSRLYLLDGSGFKQVTEDDTWAATMLRQSGGADATLLTHHPMRHVLTNVLGAREQTDVHMFEHDLVDGDTLLLCSDGIYGVLDAQALESEVKATGEPRALAERLVQSAIDRGTRDNVTALVVRYEAEA